MKYEIEHLLPDTPKKELIETFAKDNSEVQYDACENRLGDLTLLEKHINIATGNCFFADKTAEYSKSRVYLTRSIVGLASVGLNTSVTRINSALKAFNTWSAQTIEERQVLLTDLVGSIWKMIPITAT